MVASNWSRSADTEKSHSAAKSIERVAKLPFTALRHALIGEPGAYDRFSGRISADLTDVLFRPLWPHVTSAAIALLTSVILFFEVGAEATLPWTALGVLAYGTRLVLLTAYRRSEENLELAERRWVRRYCATAALLGLFWGGAPLVIAATAPSMVNDGLAALVLFVVAGMMAGGVMTSSSRVQAVSCFVWPAVAIIVAACALWERSPFMIIAVLAFIYAAMLILLGRRLNSTAVAALRGQYEKAALADQLSTANAEVRGASRAKSEFLANMSHELRTPLNAIIGFSEIMSREILGPIGLQRYRDYAADIQESGKHLLGVINDILDLSRVEAGKMTLVEDEVDLAVIMGGCARLLAHRANAGGVRLETDFAEETIRMRADEGRMRQIGFNLLTNAIKFTPQGGRVRVHLEVDAGRRVVLQIEDTGVGMRQEDIPLALTPFQQVGSGGVRNMGGTGLGLPLTKTLVELHGGTLTINSALGRGTGVTVAFPRERTISSAI